MSLIWWNKKKARSWGLGQGRPACLASGRKLWIRAGIWRRIIKRRSLTGLPTWCSQSRHWYKQVRTTSNPLTTFKQWNKMTRRCIRSPSLRQLSNTYINMPPTRRLSSNSNWGRDRVSCRGKNRESVRSSHRSFFHLRRVSGARVSEGSSNNTRREKSQELIRRLMKLNSREERKSAHSNPP